MYQHKHYSPLWYVCCLSWTWWNKRLHWICITKLLRSGMLCKNGLYNNRATLFFDTVTISISDDKRQRSEPVLKISTSIFYYSEGHISISIDETVSQVMWKSNFIFQSLSGKTPKLSGSKTQVWVSYRGLLIFWVHPVLVCTILSQRWCDISNARRTRTYLWYIVMISLGSCTMKLNVCIRNDSCFMAWVFTVASICT